jgi:predicted ATPase/DNA-binding XRE family transcriptional regulator/tetratricopeptide (TPR) repeat protein
VDFTPPFGQWLRQRRKALGLTQADLAQRLNYAEITLRKIEAGRLLPSQALAEALARMLQVPAPDLAAFIAFARGLEPQRRFNSLPAPDTSLVGRDADLAALVDILTSGETRLLSLLGPPGVGKTRLAIELARRIELTFAHGAVFIPLAALSQAEQVVVTIAQALDVHTSPDLSSLDALRRFLRDKHLLLVLDNFEHLLDAAPLVGDLLAASPCLKIVVTSRAPLRVRGEHTFDLQPLAVPDLQQLPKAAAMRAYSAVDLFVQRAQAAKPTFALTAINAPAVAEICLRLDGLPLAIELAAVRARAFTPQTMLTHLDHHIGASLRFLTSAPRDLPPRQQTLRHAIDWSYHLLSADEQRLFRRLGIFVGGCTLEAAQTVCAWPTDGGPAESEKARNAVADTLAALVEQSLVQEMEGPLGESRYSMLETIREYALEQLEASEAGSELQDVRTRFVQHFAQLIHAHDTLITDHTIILPTLDMLRNLEPDYANLLQAQRWCASVFPQPLPRLRFLLSLPWLWVMRSVLGNPSGAGDPQALLHSILEVRNQCETVPADVQAAVLHRLAWLAGQSDLPLAVQYGEQLLAHCRAHGTTAQIMFALYARGVTLALIGNLDESMVMHEEQEQLARQSGSDYDRAAALGMKGLIALARNDLAQADVWLSEALDVARRNGIDWTASATGNIYITLRDLGLTRIRQGQIARGMSLLEEALDFALRNQLALAAGACQLYLAYGDLCAKRAHSACQRLRFSMDQFQRAFREDRMPGILAELAQALMLQGRLVPAMTMAGAAAVHEESIRSAPRIDMLLQFDYLRILTEARARLADSELADAWVTGQAMTLEQAIDAARALACA